MGEHSLFHSLLLGKKSGIIWCTKSATKTLCQQIMSPTVGYDHINYMSNKIYASYFSSPANFDGSRRLVSNRVDTKRQLLAKFAG